MTDLVQEAFDIADQYRTPVMILSDGMLGQMMEPVEIGNYTPRELPAKSWATTGTRGERKPNVVNSLYIDPEVLENKVHEIYDRYAQIEQNEVKVECYNTEDADIILTAYGTTARIVKNVIAEAAKEGIKLGLVRPITLWPFPAEAVKAACAQESVKAVLSVEMSMGQMVEDVRLAVDGAKPVYFYGRTGGMIPTPDDIMAKIKEILKEG